MAHGHGCPNHDTFVIQGRDVGSSTIVRLVISASNNHPAMILEACAGGLVAVYGSMEVALIGSMIEPYANANNWRRSITAMRASSRTRLRQIGGDAGSNASAVSTIGVTCASVFPGSVRKLPGACLTICLSSDLITLTLTVQLWPWITQKARSATHTARRWGSRDGHPSRPWPHAMLSITTRFSMGKPAACRISTV